MAASPILGITQVAPSQNSKEATINNAVNALESATNALLPISMSSGNVTLTAAQFTSAVVFQVSGQTVAVTLSVPASYRFFAVQNLGAYAVTVNVTGVTGSPTTTVVLAGATSIIYCDTVNCYSVGGSSGSANGMTYKGAWNASTNTPTLTSSTGTLGFVYSVSVAGTTTLDGISQWNVGDKAIFNGSTWEKIDGLVNEVVSVAGQTGVITLSQLVTAGLAPSNGAALTSATATTPLTTDNSTKIATTAWGVSYVASLSLAPITSPAFQGTPTVVTAPAAGDSSNAIPPTSWVRAYVTGLAYAPLASPAFTGTPTVVTAPTGSDNSAAIPTTAWTRTYVASLNYAPLTSPNFLGTPTLNAPPASSDSSAAVTTTAWVRTYVASLGYVTTSNNYEVTTNKGVANGYAPLDGSGKIPTANLPSSILGALTYQGIWNANTNSPALTSGTGNKGYYYKVGTSGTTTLDGISQWNVGDEVVFDGTTWDKIDGVASEVTAVAGQTGNVTTSVLNANGVEITANKAVANGYAPLDGTSKVPIANIPTLTYSQLPTEVQSLPVPFVFVAKPAAGQIINVVMAQACTLPANLAGTVAFFTAAPAANAVFTANRIASGTATPAAIGTLTLSSGTHQTLTFSTQSAVSFAAGDVLQLVAPVTQDTLLSDGCVTVVLYKV